MWVRKHKKAAVLLGVAAVLAGSWLWDWSAPWRGRLDARIDLQQGRYRILAYGLPPPERAEYARLLKVRYGIEFRAVASCIVSESLVSYVDNYDAVSSAAIKRKFGDDVFEKTWHEAERDWVFRSTFWQHPPGAWFYLRRRRQ